MSGRRIEHNRPQPVYHVEAAYPRQQQVYQEHDTIETHGWREEHQYLHVCGTCFCLFEKKRPDGLNQRCRCAADREPTWSGWDFNERAALCRCCGFEVLRSGSRWSELFCRECRLLAMAVSVTARRLIFPIGRHSLMHMWVPRALRPTIARHRGDAARLGENVFAGLQAIDAGIEMVDEWYGTMMSRNMELLRLRSNVTLRRYVEVVVRRRVGSLMWRLQAFDGLCQYASRRPARPVRPAPM